MLRSAAVIAVGALVGPAPELGRPLDEVPSLATIQTAYEREESAGSPLHDKGLRVLEARCHDRTRGRFFCEVTFISNGDPGERLYFDIVAVARNAKGWELNSGLCKR